MRGVSEKVQKPVLDGIVALLQILTARHANHNLLKVGAREAVRTLFAAARLECLDKKGHRPGCHEKDVLSSQVRLVFGQEGDHLVPFLKQFGGASCIEAF